MTTKDIIILSLVKGIGPATIKKDMQRLKTDTDALALIKDIKPEELDNVPTWEQQAEEILTKCQEEDIEVIDIASAGYPSSLMQISNPPAVLYVKGNKKLLDNVIAIIGTRHSTVLGNRIAERLGSYFSRHFSICNGLVEGIDEHSIYVDGSVIPNAVGIISGGLCYTETCSKNHIRVIEDVLQAGGVVISEYPPKKKEDQYAGSNASRIQAGLSSGIILVQSKVDGGSRYTLNKFIKLGRVIGVVDFASNAEFQDDVFGANRLILEKGEAGLAEFVGLKTTKTLNVKDIIPISSKEDYQLFEKALQPQTHASEPDLFG